MESRWFFVAVLDEIAAQCAPQGNKKFTWPGAFCVHICDDVLIFTRPEATDRSNALLEMRADEDIGFEATRGYILALARIRLLEEASKKPAV
jgi:hypothetical protein